MKDTSNNNDQKRAFTPVPFPFFRQADSSTGRAPDIRTGVLGFESLSAYRKRNRFRIVWEEELGRSECPYMKRWAIETPIGSLRIHHWISSDDDRHFHDHPWWFLTFVLAGSYTDVNPDGRDSMTPGQCRFRPAHHQHTVEVSPGGCWTILLTGPHIRFWGFYKKGKFVKSNKYFLENGHHPCKQ